MKYVIIDKEEVQHVNWLQVCETNEDSLRYNINADKTFVKFILIESNEDQLFQN